MNITSTTNRSDTDIQALLNSTNAAGLPLGPSTSSTGSTGPLGPQNDASQLSPLAQLLSNLQQLEEQNPAQYQQVTAQIATNLQNAAKTAQSDGNTAQANQLSQLATDFQNASQTGQLPNIQDLGQAAGGGHHHHHHHSGSSSSSDAQSNSTDSLNPLTIIENTLASSSDQNPT